VSIVMSDQPKRRRPGPRPGEFEGRRQARFFEIVDQTAALFADQGFTGTNINEIGEAVGLGRGALYHYIESKGNVLTEIQNRFMGPLISALDEIVASDVEPTIKLCLASRSHLSIQTRLLDHSRVITREARNLPPDGREMFRKNQKTYEKLWSTILEEGQASRDFVIENVSITRLAILSMHNYTLNWVRPGGSLTAEQISQHYCRILLGGIAPDRDFDKIDDEVSSAIERLGLKL